MMDEAIADKIMQIAYKDGLDNTDVVAQAAHTFLATETATESQMLIVTEAERVSHFIQCRVRDIAHTSHVIKMERRGRDLAQGQKTVRIEQCGNEERLYGLTPAFIVAVSPRNWGRHQQRLMTILRIMEKRKVPLRVVF